jgi:hypothetical protein
MRDCMTVIHQSGYHARILGEKNFKKKKKKFKKSNAGSIFGALKNMKTNL